MSLRFAAEIEAVQSWYGKEGARTKYWIPNSLWPDEMMATKERVQLGHDVKVLIQYLEREEIAMDYYCADDLKINLKSLVREMSGPGMVAHIARTRVHHPH